MTRKHFTAIASDLRDARDAVATAEERAVLDTLARNLARTFAQFNPSFDRQQFLTACGVSPIVRVA